MCHSFVPSFIHNALNEHLLLRIMLGAREVEMDTSRFLNTGNSSSEEQKETLKVPEQAGVHQPYTWRGQERKEAGTWKEAAHRLGEVVGIERKVGGDTVHKG